VDRRIIGQRSSKSPSKCGICVIYLSPLKALARGPMHNSVMARRSLLFACPSTQPSTPHLHPRLPSDPTTLRGAPIASYRHTPPINMLACRSFAAPARQCLRRANGTSRWAPALAQVSAPAVQMLIALSIAKVRGSMLMSNFCAGLVTVVRCEGRG
jgi:hypothetical protein